MANVPPKGLFGRSILLEEGPASVAIDVQATLIGETTPRLATEVWSGDAAGVPQLVWVRNVEGPTAATATYISGTPASLGRVEVSWTPQNPLRSDGYEIRRPDGSLAGTVDQTTTLFVDLTPRPLNGSYTVTAKLGGVSDPTPTSTNSLNLSTGPASFAATFGGTLEVLQWTAPSWGKPHQYQIWRSVAGGAYSLLTTVDGGTLTFDDTGIQFGQTYAWQVFAVLSSIKGGGSATDSEVLVPLVPNNVSLSTPAPDTLRLSWSAPTQTAVSYFEVQNNGGIGGTFQAHQNVSAAGTTSDWSTVNAGQMRVRTVGVNGQVSGWVTSGSVAPIPPAPTLSYYGAHPSQPAYNRAITSLTGPGFTWCGEYYWSGFPQYGWRTSFAFGTTACQTPAAGIPGVWDMDKLQSTPTYFRIKTVRNGVDSAWTQYGPS